MPKPFLVAVALTVAVMLTGCSNNNEGAGGRPVDRNAPPDVLVKNAVETRTNLSSVAGKGVMRIVDQPNRFGLTVNADVVADESDRLRIRADKLAGAIQAFDVVKIGDDIGFYIPTQKAFYQGKVGELRNFSFRFDPDEVLRQMLRPETALLLKRWRNAEPAPGDPKDAIMLEEDAPANRPRLRLAIGRRSGMILAVTQLDAKGQPYMIKRFDDYRSLGRDRRSKGDEGVFPYLIAFSWPRDQRSMEMRFKSVEGNAVVLDDDYDIAPSSDTRFLPLMEAQMDPSLSDEPVAAVASDSALADLR